jgi:DNA polymerase III alpha subunit (gram-positive type)
MTEKLKKGAYLRVQGEVQFDKYSKEINLMAKNIMLGQPPVPRMDTAENGTPHGPLLDVRRHNVDLRDLHE